MATLKISGTHDHYITQIKTLTRMRDFAVPKKSEVGEDPRALDDAILKIAFGDDTWHRGLTRHIGNFEDVRFGIALEVERETGERQCWVVPEHSVFLMADNGRTIDRL